MIEPLALRPGEAAQALGICANIVGVAGVARHGPTPDFEASRARRIETLTQWLLSEWERECADRSAAEPTALRLGVCECPAA